MATNLVAAERTNWQASSEQQSWFDQFALTCDQQRTIGAREPALNFQQFQAFLKATLYCYFESFPSQSVETCRNGHCRAQQLDSKHNSLPAALDELDLESHGGKFSKVQEMHLFKKFDLDNDHLIDRDEFAHLCHKWFNQVFRPACALVVVDVQNDFIDGSLALINGPARQDGAEVVPVVNELVDMFQAHKATVVYTQDWHPQDHVSFHSNLHLRKYTIKSLTNQLPNNDNQKSKTDKDFKYKRLVPKAELFDTVVFDEGRVEQKLWPIHCVRNSWGAQFHPKLKMAPDSIRIQKGTLSHVDAYSAFWDNMKMNETGLRQELLNKHISDLFFCGLATDYCVAASALDSAKAGFITFVVDDACRGIDEKEIEQRKEMLRDNGAFIVSSGMVSGYLALSAGTELDSVSSSKHCLGRSLIKSITYRKAFC